MDVSTRAAALCEVKVIRHVRTPAGVRKYGQPIGTIIVADGKLNNLKSKTPVWDGWELIEDSKGRQYDVGERDGEYIATLHGEWDPIITGGSLEDVYKDLDKHVGGKKKPGATGGGDKPLDKMTVNELRQYARDNGMSSITRLGKRSELLRAIEQFNKKKRPASAPSKSSFTAAQQRRVDEIMSGSGSATRKSRELRNYGEELYQRYGERANVQHEELNRMADEIHRANDRDVYAKPQGPITKKEAAKRMIAAVDEEFPDDDERNEPHWEVMDEFSVAVNRGTMAPGDAAEQLRERAAKLRSRKAKAGYNRVADVLDQAQSEMTVIPDTQGALDRLKRRDRAKTVSANPDMPGFINRGNAFITVQQLGDDLQEEPTGHGAGVVAEIRNLNRKFGDDELNIEELHRELGNIARRFQRRPAVRKMIEDVQEGLLAPDTRTQAQIRADTQAKRQAAIEAVKKEPIGADGKPIRVDDHVYIGKYSGSYGRTTWKVKRIWPNGQIGLESTYRVSGRTPRTRNIEPEKLSHFGDTAPEAPTVSTEGVEKLQERARNSSSATLRSMAKKPDDSVAQERMKRGDVRGAEQAYLDERRAEIDKVANPVDRSLVTREELNQLKASSRKIPDYARVKYGAFVYDIENGDVVSMQRNFEELDTLFARNGIGANEGPRGYVQMAFTLAKRGKPQEVAVGPRNHQDNQRWMDLPEPLRARARTVAEERMRSGMSEDYAWRGALGQVSQDAGEAIGVEDAKKKWGLDSDYVSYHELRTGDWIQYGQDRDGRPRLHIVKNVSSDGRHTRVDIEGLPPISMARDARVQRFNWTGPGKPGMLYRPKNRHDLDRLGRLEPAQAETVQGLATRYNRDGATEAASWRRALDETERTFKAQTRQRRIDEVRPIGQTIAMVDQWVDGGRLDKDTMLNQLQQYRDIATPGSAADLVYGEIYKAIQIANLSNEVSKDNLRRNVAFAARAHGIHMLNAAGDIDFFNPKRHKPLLGNPALGDKVEVPYPGFMLKHDGEEIILERSEVVPVGSKSLEGGLEYKGDREGGVHKGAMVALIPRREDAERLVVSDGEPLEELHLTLRYLGDAENLDHNARVNLVAVTKTIAEQTNTMMLDAFALNMFNPNGEEPCIVLGIGDPTGAGIARLQEEVCRAVDGCNVKIPPNHSPFVPHVTLKYSGDVSEMEELKDRAGLITFDRIRIVFGGEATDFPLREDNLGRPYVDDSEPAVLATLAKGRAASLSYKAGFEEKKRKLPKTEKCKHCEDRATTRVLWAEGRAYQAACDKHKEVQKRKFGSDFSGFRPIKPTKDHALDLSYKVVRRVRTEAGVRRFGQPLGSIIVADGKLDNLKLLDPKWDGFDLVQGTNRKKYDVGKVSGKYTATIHGDWEPVVIGSSLEDVFKKLNDHVGGGAAKTTVPKPKLAPVRQRPMTLKAAKTLEDFKSVEQPSRMQTKLKDLNGSLAKEIAGLYEGKFGKFKTEVNTESSFVQGKRLLVYGKIKTARGQEVGYFVRSIDLESGISVNSELELDDKYTGQRFADNFYPETAKRLKAVGVKKIQLTANDDVGGYAWARRGMPFDEKTWQASQRSVVRNINTFLNITQDLRPEDQKVLKGWVKTISKAKSPNDPNVPTPAEIASFGEGKYQYKRMTKGGRKFISWPGKDILLGSTWEGEQDIDSMIEKKSLAPDEYMDRLRDLYDEEEARYAPDSYQPHDGNESDYNLFHIDLFMPPTTSNEKKGSELRANEAKLIGLLDILIKGHVGMAKRAANRKRGSKGWAVDLAYEFKRVRHVRTAAGARKYGQPIGTIIELDDPIEVPSSRSSRSVRSRSTSTSRTNASARSTGAASTRSRSTGSSLFPGMKKATTRDRQLFKQTVGKPIPPAWTDVYIAEDLPTAKILARGKDVKGRAQTLYSQAHTEGQAEVKFTRIKKLQPHLRKLDAAIQRDAMKNDSAAALLLIRRLGMRPGSDRDTGADKQAHGATNLKASHVTVTPGGKVKFDFTGKKGVHIQLETNDELIARVIKKYKTGKRGNTRLFNTDEAKTRAYMKSTGVPDGYLLKDLRTVHANVVALREIKARGKTVPQTKTEFRKWRKEVAVAVSDELGNTPTLALSSYINPTVFRSWLVDEDWA